MSLAIATPVTPTNTTDPQFRAWGSLVSGKLAAMGLVQTSDTGQINWTTVLAPTLTNTAQGYELWHFADALQSTAPVFLKLEYGSGLSAAAQPAIWLSVGSGSNGSGALTGVLSARQQFYCSQSASPITGYFCGDVDRVVFCFQGSSTSFTLLIALERTLDLTGARTAEGVLIAGYGPGAFQRAWNCVTGPYTIFETSFGCLGAQVAPFGSTGTQVAVYPVLFNKGVFFPYGLNLFGYVDATIGANVALSFPVYGTNHQYMPLGTGALSTVLMRTTAATAMLMRFD